jgi:hypothetical protein
MAPVSISAYGTEECRRHVANKMKMGRVLASLLLILTIVSTAHARHIEETGLGAGFDEEGKTIDDICREARKDAERKVPRGAKNVKYTRPVFTGVTVSGKHGHNCLVYVSFDTNNQDDDGANPYKLEGQLTPAPKSSGRTEACPNPPGWGKEPGEEGPCRFNGHPCMERNPKTAQCVPWCDLHPEGYQTGDCEPGEGGQ